jgi:uncharacterized protein YndB with AHSA1/START domain
MAQIETDAVIREIRIEARPETIFPFFTDPAEMTRWMGRSATLDPRPGGALIVDVTGRDAARGEFVEVTPPTRVVFTWGWEGSDHAPPTGASTVEIDLEPAGDGTLVRLTHRGLDADSAAKHDHGWTHYLGRLELVASGRDPGPDPWVASA